VSAPKRGTAGDTDALDHLALNVSDMERALGFYCDLLGCEVLGQLRLEGGRRKLVYLRCGGAYVELFSVREPAGGTPAAHDVPALGFQHVAFHAADVDAVAARLRAAGTPCTLGPLDAVGNVRLAFFLDPDGNDVEIVSRLPDMEPYRPGWD